MFRIDLMAQDEEREGSDGMSFGRPSIVLLLFQCDVASHRLSCCAAKIRLTKLPQVRPSLRPVPT